MQEQIPCIEDKNHNNEKQKRLRNDKNVKKKKVVKLHCWIKPSASRPSEMYRANERHKPSSKSTKIAQEASTFWSDHLDNKHTYFPLINNLGARFTKQGYQSLSLDLG